MKNISAKYKLMALVPLFVLTGCKRTEHKNVIIGKMTNDTERMLLFSDVQSGQQRAFIYSKGKRKSSYDYLEVGDTVSLFTGGRLLSEDCYQKHLLLDFYDVEIKYNADSVQARQKMKHFNVLKNQTIKTR